MSPELVDSLVTIGIALAAVLVPGGAGYGVYRLRKNGQQQPQPQPWQPGGDADQSGQFLEAFRQVPEKDARAFIRAVTASIEQRPATQADVKRAISDWGAEVRKDINGHFEVHSKAIVDLRDRFNCLPCQGGMDCDGEIVRVPVTDRSNEQETG